MKFEFTITNSRWKKLLSKIVSTVIATHHYRDDTMSRNVPEKIRKMAVKDILASSKAMAQLEEALLRHMDGVITREVLHLEQSEFVTDAFDEKELFVSTLTHLYEQSVQRQIEVTRR